MESACVDYIGILNGDNINKAITKVIYILIQHIQYIPFYFYPKHSDQMYHLKRANVPLGVHVPQFGNPCSRNSNRSFIGTFVKREVTSKLTIIKS